MCITMLLTELLFLLNSITFLRLGKQEVEFHWDQNLWEAHRLSEGLMKQRESTVGLREKSNVVATKAQQIPKGRSSGVGKALQRSLKRKQKMRRPGFCALAFGAGCLWGEESKIPSAHGSSWAENTVSPSTGNSPGSWEKRVSRLSLQGKCGRDTTISTTQHWCRKQVNYNCFQKQVFWEDFHVHGFLSILSSCTHWHVNPVC